MAKSIFAATICFVFVLATVIDAGDLILTLPTKYGSALVLSNYKHPILFVSYLIISISFFGCMGYLLCWSIKVENFLTKEDKKQRDLQEQKQKEKQVRLDQLKQQRQNKQKKARGRWRESNRKN